jgi:group I intron endonuclease
MDSISSTPSIYQFRHIASGKVYVGSAVNPRRRRNTHIQRLKKGTHHSRHLQNAWNKYGEIAFVFEIIEPVLFVEDLLVREQYWIDKKRSADRKYGFNVTPTAGSLLGTKQTEEQRTRRSEQYTDPEFSAKYSAGQKRRYSNPAERARAGASFRKRLADPVERAKLFEGANASHATPEFRALKSEQMKARLADADVRAAMSQQTKERWAADPEWKNRMSIRIKAMWADPEKRASLIAKQQAGRAKKKAEQS